MQKLFDFLTSARGSMVLSLACSIVTSIGHHWFYHSLNGQPPPITNYQLMGYKKGIPGQQLNIVIGCLFAFAFKSFVSIAASISQKQSTWRAMKTDPIKISTIDNLYNNDVFSLAHFQLWKSYPIPMVLALIYWLLPVGILLTPGTLNIQVGLSKNSAMMRVPMIDFKSLNFANIPGGEMDGGNFAYSNPQLFVQQVVTATTSAGQILNITAPVSNSSWSLDFYGPALSCGPAEDVLRQKITDQGLAAIVSSSGSDSECGSGGLLNYEYLSWTPGSGDNVSLPFDYSISNITESYTLRSTTLGSVNSSPALFFMAISHTINPYELSQCCENTTCWQGYKDFITNDPIIHCTAYNASYTSRFNYPNGVQSVDIAVKEALNDLGFLSNVTLWTQAWDGTTLSVALENFAYQAVIDAFGKMVVGSVVSDENGYNDKTTNIEATNLVNTKELGFLKASGSYTQESTLQSYLPGTDLWNETSAVPRMDDTIGLAQAIEEMFQNCTVSLMSSPMLQPDYTSPYAPPDTNVTLVTFSNVYTYSAGILWLAYGIAICFTIISIITGFIIVSVNDGSYSDDFSTVLRVTSNISLSRPLQSDETTGKEPTLEHVKDIVVSFPRDGRSAIKALLDEESYLQKTNVKARTYINRG
ncbi:hypothetical protein N431DRAFT_323142 [Stipitochalara longipes BDJ]|nr:hypothetical protein N431DRAFT_323142 [Stipitochalara longipes BDJ]